MDLILSEYMNRSLILPTSSHCNKSTDLSQMTFFEYFRWKHSIKDVAAFFPL